MLEYSPIAETMGDEITTKIKGVPYYSQSLDCVDGNGNIDKYWFRRACGITCAKMVIDYFIGSNKKTIVELADEGRNKGGYNEHGWKHDYFVSLFNQQGLQAYRKEGMEYGEGVKEIALHINEGGLVIASCIVPFMGEKDYHMVVLKGVRWKDDRRDAPLGFYYSDPDSLYPDKAEERFVGTEIFGNYWRRMAIFIKK